MLIKSLEDMEKIVLNNKSLRWDGWSVINLTPIESGIMLKDSVQVDGKWYLKKIYELTEEGWNIPNKIVG